MRHGVHTPSKYFCVVDISQDYREGQYTAGSRQIWEEWHKTGWERMKVTNKLQAEIGHDLEYGANCLPKPDPNTQY